MWDSGGDKLGHEVLHVGVSSFWLVYPGPPVCCGQEEPAQPLPPLLLSVTCCLPLAFTFILSACLHCRGTELCASPCPDSALLEHPYSLAQGCEFLGAHLGLFRCLVKSCHQTHHF